MKVQNVRKWNYKYLKIALKNSTCVNINYIYINFAYNNRNVALIGETKGMFLLM